VPPRGGLEQAGATVAHAQELDAALRVSEDWAIERPSGMTERPICNCATLSHPNHAGRACNEPAMTASGLCGDCAFFRMGHKAGRAGARAARREVGHYTTGWITRLHYGESVVDRVPKRRPPM
jgi:hypothetical protein